jgi:flagellar biosynthetic protein FliQ
MTEEVIMKLGQQTIQTATLLATPMLAGALIVGLLVSIFQAVTQINEATLTFIPKMAIVVVVILLAGPWMLDVLSTFTVDLFENIADVIRE